MEESIKKGSARMISYGLYQPELYPSLAQTTCILEANYGVGTCIRRTLEPDHYSRKSDQYGAELSGLLAGLLATLLVCKHHQEKGGYIDIGCDGDSELNVSKSSRNSHHISFPNADLRKAIARVKAKIKR